MLIFMVNIVATLEESLVSQSRNAFSAHIGGMSSVHCYLVSLS